jgi:mannose-1-phosphate guanylyltransferase
MVEAGALYALASDCYWLDVGTPERYLRATADLLAGVRAGPPVCGARAVPERSWMMDGAVNDGEVTGSFLGVHARVAFSAVIDASVVGRDAVVGAGAVVERSALLRGARIHPGALVRDSIVGSGAVIGAGAVLRGGTVVGAREVVAAGTNHEGARLPA